RLMKSFCSMLFAAAVLALASQGALAASQTVTVGPNGSNTFSMKDVTINAGESVTFTYSGGGMAHNVHADDGSFPCAHGCDGQGGNGSVSNTAWSSTVTFNQPGTFRYYCDLHGAPGGIGMAGSVTVNAVAPPPPPPQGQNIVSGLSGNWDDPQP